MIHMYIHIHMNTYYLSIEYHYMLLNFDWDYTLQDSYPATHIVCINIIIMDMESIYVHMHYVQGTYVCINLLKYLRMYIAKKCTITTTFVAINQYVFVIKPTLCEHKFNFDHILNIKSQHFYQPSIYKLCRNQQRNYIAQQSQQMLHS